MKNHGIAKSANNSASPGSQRPAGLRLHTAKAIEHRHERRKLREQLRRLDGATDLEDQILA